MTYVMSDIHGEYDRYIAMLEKIQFSDEDVLYIIGDCIDRHPGGVAVLEDIFARKNAFLILGNHERMMLDTFGSGDTYDARRLWQYNGGGITRRILIYKRTPEERVKLLRILRSLPDHLDIEVNGRKFHLVHGYPSDDPYLRIWGRPEPPPEEPPIPGVTTIIGHTSTYFLNGEDESKPLTIWHGPGLIDIDCGCASGASCRQLACLRLDDMAEFYV